MFPKYPLPTLFRPTWAAYATYKLLIDPFNRTRSIEQEAAPFFRMMKTLIFQSRPPRPSDFSALLEAFPDIRYMQSRKYGKDRGTTFLTPVSIPQNPSHHLRATIHRQLGNAISSRNLGALKKAWVDFWGVAATPDESHVKELVKHPELFDYFILAYMTLRRPELAVDVWNSMERIGIRPTVKTWNSMLQGCAKAGNADGIRTVWHKLIVSGTQLDTAIWTARIHGFFASRDPDAGLRALDEMVKIWAARGEPANKRIAVQPTAEPVNAVLAGLIRLGRESDARHVLLWASKQGIEPDIYTFNTLLRPLLRRGDMAAIEALFETMRSANISADVTTFTLMLEGTLTDISHLAPPEQVALVRHILTEMKSAGIEANMQTYAKILHLLLRQGGDQANEPVKAVLAHIWRRGLELTSHIYTMLAEHYFSRDPPDAAAVTALIENRRLHDNKDIDRVFWERVIKGYCQAGETERALAIFDRVFVSGTNITFSTLYDLLKAVIKHDDGTHAAAAPRIVEAARKIGMADEERTGDGPSAVAPPTTHAERKRLFKHRFWHLAHQHGLLGEQLGVLLASR
jgi:pentatricopeptide repeat protein